MAELSANAATVRANLQRIQTEIAETCHRVGRNPEDVKICAATKYVDADGMQALADAGVRVAAENRLQDLASKQDRFEDLFEWHFIGAIQSRKAREIASRVEVIHSLATDSARAKLLSHDLPLPKLLVQVNVSGESSKQGVAPGDLERFIAESPADVCGLMTMPPASENADDVRRFFAQLRMLAERFELDQLSIGTSQDYLVAIEEGATLVRLGATLFRPQTN